MVKLFFICAHLLLEGLARRYTFPVDLIFIGSIIHETLTNNVYLGISRGIKVENGREERVYRHTVDDGMINGILVRIRVFSSWSPLGLHN